MWYSICNTRYVYGNHYKLAAIHCYRSSTVMTTEVFLIPIYEVTTRNNDCKHKFYVNTSRFFLANNEEFLKNSSTCKGIWSLCKV